MPINAREKGKAGELEFCHRFSPFFHTELKRNLLQTREGGADIDGCAPFQIEVKRCQKVELKKWWRQVNAAIKDPAEIPTVAYRQNKQPWRFLLPAYLLGVDDNGFIEVNEDIWVKFVMKVLPPPF